MTRYKKLYKTFLENGELFELFPELEKESNSWEQDQKEFKMLMDLMEHPQISDNDIYE